MYRHYLRARYYDQGIGRFTQMDTWMGRNSDPVTLHKYLYGNVDPVNMMDPSGNTSLSGFGASFGAGAILSTLATYSVINGIQGGASTGSRGGERRWSLWDVVATAKLSAKTLVIPLAVAVTRTRNPNDLHHTIPIYLCGAVSQNLSSIKRSDHVAIHTGLAAIAVAVESAENAADKVIPFGRRTSGDVLSLAGTRVGRTIISGAIETYYNSAGWWNKGEPSIGTVFPNEQRKFINGTTSLPDCKRKSK